MTKHLSLCREVASGVCDPAAGFTVRQVVVWPSLGVDDSTYLGAMGTNPYSKRQIFGQAMPKGSGTFFSVYFVGCLLKMARCK